jgi:hypothetical protein
MPAPSLPYELWELIVNHLSLPDDKRSLEALALVCRASVLPSQRRLFSTLTVDSADACARLAAVFHTSPHLRPHLRNLRLDRRRSRPDWLVGDEWASRPVLLAQCRRVTSRDVANMTIRDGVDIFGRPVFSNVESLVLGPNMSVFSSRQLVVLLGQFPRLRDVTICFSDCFCNDVPPAFVTDGIVHLRTLRIVGFIASAWKHVPSNLRVDNIELDVCDTPDLILLHNLLTGASRSPKEVRCHLKPAFRSFDRLYNLALCERRSELIALVHSNANRAKSPLGRSSSFTREDMHNRLFPRHGF